MDVTTTTKPFAVTRNTLLAGGGLALAGLGLAAGLALRSPPEAPGVEAQAQAATPPQATTQPQKIAAAPTTPAKAERASSARKAPSGDSGRSTPLDTQPVANACSSCGVIEGVRSFQKKGEASGLGAVAGGVLGGALGNQVGKGNGRSAMTVLGAVGGGVAGHEIEKRAKSETLYEVRVRMDDGSLRTLTQKSAPAPGARVFVEGDTLRSAGSGAPADSPRMMRTATQGA